VKALDGWKPANQEEILWMNHFNAYVLQNTDNSEYTTKQVFSTLEGELQKLKELSEESNFRKFLDHEDEQARIKDTFVRINEARVQFEVRAMIFCSSALAQCHCYVAWVGYKSLQGGV
jgi:hypothetical protein